LSKTRLASEKACQNVSRTLKRTRRFFRQKIFVLSDLSWTGSATQILFAVLSVTYLFAFTVFQFCLILCVSGAGGGISVCNIIHRKADQKDYSPGTGSTEAVSFGERA